MAINKLEAGDYLGYTYGGVKPTLYFENGHFTQLHDYENNIGWHSSGGRHHYGNIGIEGQSMLSQTYKIRDKKAFELELKSFISKFELGGFSSNSSEAVLFECFLKGKQFFTHQSKSKLIKKGDMDYDREFDKAYINKVLSNGNWAVNEYKVVK